MIPKSTLYKLVNSNGIVIAEGSSKEMKSLQKKNKGSRIWLSSNLKIGDKAE